MVVFCFHIYNYSTGRRGMASLTPGLLSKLLDSVGNKDIKVTGEHRLPLLQVIEIVPSLSDDPWHSNGFFLKLSDSRHAAYVSLSPQDMDLIYADKIQLGQFVYMDGLDKGSPVPVLRGLKPLPKRRPFVGTPTDLVPSHVLLIRPSVHFSKKGNNFQTKRDGFGGSTKKNEGLDSRRLSLDSARRVWEPRKSSAQSPSRLRTKQVLADRKASDPSLKRPTLSISPLKNKNGRALSKLVDRPSRDFVKSSSDEAIPSHLVKVPLNFKTWSDQRISWDALPPTIKNLGKEAVSHRNVAFLAAVQALEEASCSEAVINCLYAFAGLCDSSQKPGPLVEQFLDIHHSMQIAAVAANSLLHAQANLPSMCKTSSKKNAKSWVQAAIHTNLSKFSIFSDPEKAANYLIIEHYPSGLNSGSDPPQSQRKQSSISHYSSAPDSDATRTSHSLKRYSSSLNKMNVEKDKLSGESGLKEAANLAEKLLTASRQWFFKYLETSLNNGFGINGSTEIACLLGQLKRVNTWLDDIVGSGMQGDEKIEDIRKKLYRFLLANVDSAIVCK